MKNRFCFLFSFLFIAFTSCTFISSFQEQEDSTSISFSTNEKTVDIGAMDVVELTVSNGQNNVDIQWEYDASIIYAKTDNYGIVFTGLVPGSTVVTARYSPSVTARCIINVSQNTHVPAVINPYVYSSTDFVGLEKGQTTKVCASLFGGTNADINGYSWSIDKPSVASIAAEGNYCWITGLASGTARVTAKHSKATYGYSFLVDVSNTGTVVSYLTTTDNIVTINLSSDELTKDISFTLKNPVTGELDSFSYSVVDENGATYFNAPAQIESTNGNVCTIRGVSAGNCYLRCSHPDTSYDFDVLVRVVKDAELTYIEPSETFVVMNGDETKSVSLSLINSKDIADPSKFTWSFSNNASDLLEYNILNGNGSATGDTINFSAKKSGTVTATVSYPNCYDRNIVIIIRDVASEASSASTFITTSQNYVRLNKGESVSVNVIINDCVAGDINNLTWGVVNTASDGSTKNVISWVEGNGKSTSTSSNRSAALTYSEQAYCIIRGENAGTASINISHPRAIYPTKINICVEDEKPAINESFISAVGSPIVKFKNGNTYTLSVIFSGSGSAEDIVWSLSDSSPCSISPNGTSCTVTAPAEGNGINTQTVTVTHRYLKYPLTFTVMTYDEEDNISDYTFKSLYTGEQIYRRITVGGNESVTINTEGIDDLSKIRWEIAEGEKNISLSSNSPTNIIVYAVKSGRSVVRATFDGCNDLYFTFEIKDNEIINEARDVYLSTTDNVVYFADTTVQKDISVFLTNISETANSQIVWSCDSTDFTVSGNGNRASVTANKMDVQAVVTVSHPKSSNTLTIYLRSGKKYEYINTDYTYITTDKETLELTEGGKDGSITALIKHTEDSELPDDNRYFSFSSNAPEVCAVSYVSGTNICYITPLKQGVATVSIRSTKTDIVKDVMVIVNKAEFSDSIPYLTTSNNVITVLEGDSATVTASLVNSSTVDISKWHWLITGADREIAQIAANNGNTALLKGLKPGQAYVTLTHDDCDFSIRFIVIVISAGSAATVPYITSSDNIVTLSKGQSYSVSASLIGGNSPGDVQYFNWSISDSTVALINPSQENCSIKGMKAGITYITIKNSRYSQSYSKTILVIVEDTSLQNVYITTNTSVIKLSPSSKELTVVKATLNGGEPTDGEDFVWWCDDPNLLGITAVAENCSIVPSGKSGTTKLHVKHGKAAKVCDVLVLISEFENFEFSEPAVKVTSGRLYFAALKVPATESKITVEYKSDDESICYIDGSTDVAYLAGGKAGNTTVWAYMKSGRDVVATAQMLVSVTVQNELLPVISLGESIINAEVGDSFIISGSIAGGDINSDERYNLRWQVTSSSPVIAGTTGISFIDNEADGTFTGPDCKINLHCAGKYIVTVSHPGSGVSSQLLFHVQEQGELRLSLDPDYIVVSKEDGTFEITATIENGKQEDYNSIEWSCLKPSGNQIVKVSKQKGKICSVTPVKSGTTTVYAKLPNCEPAKCIVNVQQNAEIKVSTGAVHVIPGRTVEVDYYTTPSDAQVMWYKESTTQSSSMTDQQEFFSYTVDTIAHKLYITGISQHQNGPVAQMKAVMTSENCTTTPVISVFVEYNMEVNLYSGSTGSTVLTTLNNNSAATASKRYFRVETYPEDMVVEIEPESLSYCKDNTNKDSLYSINVTKTSRKDDSKVDFTYGVNNYTITPRGEGECVFRVTAYLPEDSGKVNKIVNKFTYKCYYDSYNIRVVPINDKKGQFSRWVNDNTLYLGDGETAYYYLECTDENNNCSIELRDSDKNFAQYTNANWKDNYFQVSLDSNASSPSKPVFKIDSPQDYVEEGDFYILNKNYYLNVDEQNTGNPVKKYFVKDNAKSDLKLNYRSVSFDFGDNDFSEVVIDTDVNNTSVILYGKSFVRLSSNQSYNITENDFNIYKNSPDDILGNYIFDKDFVYWMGDEYYVDKRMGSWPYQYGGVFEKRNPTYYSNYSIQNQYNWKYGNQSMLPYGTLHYSVGGSLGDSYYSNSTTYNNENFKACNKNHYSISTGEWTTWHEENYYDSGFEFYQYYDDDNEFWPNFYVNHNIIELAILIGHNENYKFDYRVSNLPKHVSTNTAFSTYTYIMPEYNFTAISGHWADSNHTVPIMEDCGCPLTGIALTNEREIITYNPTYSIGIDNTDSIYIISGEEFEKYFVCPEMYTCNYTVPRKVLLQENTEYNKTHSPDQNVKNDYEPAKTISFNLYGPDGRQKSGAKTINVKLQVRGCEAYTSGTWTKVQCGDYAHYVHSN